MWHFRSKCQRIKALVKVSHKWLKAALVLGIKKLSSLSLVLKLGKFPLFDKFFPDLADFRNLDNFWLFDFPDFLAISTPLTPLLLLSSPTSSLLEIDISDGATVFSIEVSGAVILLKPLMNCQ